jgi:hypothetical protein
MRINSICSSFNADYKHNTKPKFRGLIKDKTALPIINNLSKEDRIEFRKIEKRLAKTKYWDMKISSLGDKLNEFKFQFINKKNNSIISDGIYPYNRDGKTIRYYSVVYGPEDTFNNTIESLKFKTEKRAEELYNKYEENIETLANRRCNISPVESIKMKEVELRMLEEAFDSYGKNHHSKTVTTELQTKRNVGNELFKN